MKPRIALAAGLAAWMLAHSTVTGASQDQPPVLRVSVTTVQVDAVVTDRDGKQVTGLRAEDFEILQDDRPQTVATFGYVGASTATDGTARRDETTPGTAPAQGAAAGAAPPSTAARPGRLLVVVVDDLTLSPESMLRTRNALTNIVDTQLEPADRIALVRTSGGVGLLQQFTSDKAMLRERIARLRFNPRQFERDDYKVAAENEFLREWPPLRNPFTGQYPGSTRRDPPPPDVDPKLANAANEEHRAANEPFSAGVLATLQGVVEGLRSIRGRKGVLLFSDGFTLTGATGGGVHPMLEQTLHRLIDRATRAHAVIYAMNVRPWEMMNGADRDLGGSPFRASVEGTAQADRVDALRTASFSQTAEGPAYLASQTGGFFFRNPPDLSLVTRRALDDQRGYYLLGYTPDAKTIEQDREGRTFHRLAVRLRGRPGLSVRSRKGFLGGPDSSLAAEGSALANAAVSPFSASTLDLRLTGFFAGRDGDQSIVRTLVYVDGAGLEFQRGGKGAAAETYLEVLTLLVDDRGTVVKRDQQSYRVRSRENVAGRGGFVYRLDVPVKTPGPYNVRVAAREVASNKMGSASQFVIVPDLGRKRLALSGVLLSGSDGATELTSGTAEPVHPAVRRFKMPADLGYAFQIYNAQYAKDSRKPALRAQVRLLRDERVVYTGPLVEMQTTAKEGTHVSAIGSLSLGSQTSPGDYTLVVTVTDSLAAKEHATATSTIDFTVEP